MLASGLDGAAFGAALLASVAALVALLVVTFICGVIAKRNNVIDTAWGLGFALVALSAFLAARGEMGAGSGSDAVRRWVLLILPVIWGVRLALYLGVRSLGKGEDPRYAEMLGRGAPPGGRSAAAQLVRAAVLVYLLQGGLVLFISLPLIVGASTQGPMTALGWLGVAIWALGLIFEAVGDAQMSAFKKDPSAKGTIMDRGLWRYTRHPNYFGDACVWTGMFLIIAQHWPGILTVLSPIAMILLLTKGSGAANLERHMAARPGYAQYRERTSGFLPLPPRSPSTPAQ